MFSFGKVGFDLKNLGSAKRIIVLILTSIGVLAHTFAYIYIWMNVYNQIMREGMYRSFWGKGFYLLGLIYFILLFFFSATYGVLKIGYLKQLDIFFSQVIALIFTNVISYLQICLLSLGIVTPLPLLGMMLIQIAFAFVWTWICYLCYRNLFPASKLLLISGDRPIDDILAKFGSRPDKFRIEKCLKEDLGQKALEKEIIDGSYNGIILWDINAGLRNKLIKFCYSKNIQIYTMPKISDIILRGSSQLNLFDTPILSTKEYTMTIEQRFAKRLIDIICSLILIILTSPFMLITAILVKCYDHGPILYKQVRCTQDMKEFKILKFRSMRTDAEKDGVARLASKNDDRITPIGKFIRKVRLDELPQLFNILKGEMSFIGPRPERPEIIKQYQEDMPEFVFRTKVKAGLAGYAQVYGKYNTTPYDKLKLDLFYIENYSVWLDLMLMLLTIKVLFTPDATEGVDENQVTAMKKIKALEEEK